MDLSCRGSLLEAKGPLKKRQGSTETSKIHLSLCYRFRSEDSRQADLNRYQLLFFLGKRGHKCYSNHLLSKVLEYFHLSAASGSGNWFSSDIYLEETEPAGLSELRQPPAPLS